MYVATTLPEPTEQDLVRASVDALKVAQRRLQDAERTRDELSPHASAEAMKTAEDEVTAREEEAHQATAACISVCQQYIGSEPGEGFLLLLLLATGSALGAERDDDDDRTFWLLCSGCSVLAARSGC